MMKGLKNICFGNMSKMRLKQENFMKISKEILFCLRYFPSILHTYPQFKWRINNNWKQLASSITFSESVKNQPIFKSRTSTFDSSLFDCHLESGSSMIPHFMKREKGGEDALCLKDNFFVIADGVGGWMEVGIDPSKYSKALCQIIPKHFNSWQEKGKKFNQENIKNLLIQSIWEVNQMNILGSSTICAFVIEKSNNTLYSVNIGDSCFLIARAVGDSSSKGFQLYYKSEEQQHAFNVPYQCGCSGDSPCQAATSSHKLCNKDVIILGTDGLWDNLGVDDILKILKDSADDKLNINSQQVADYLTKEAEKLSHDERYHSPFSQNAEKNNVRYIGGKPDDISVIVTQIIDRNDMWEQDTQEEKKSISTALSADIIVEETKERFHVEKI